LGNGKEYTQRLLCAMWLSDYTLYRFLFSLFPLRTSSLLFLFPMLAHPFTGPGIGRSASDFAGRGLYPYGGYPWCGPARSATFLVRTRNPTILCSSPRSKVPPSALEIFTYGARQIHLPRWPRLLYRNVTPRCPLSRSPECLGLPWKTIRMLDDLNGPGVYLTDSRRAARGRGRPVPRAAGRFAPRAARC